MKDETKRGEFGAWLRRVRRERFANVTAAVKAMQNEVGYGIAPSVWAELESGTRRPSDEQRQRLTRYFGSEPVPSTVTMSLEEGTLRAEALRQLIEASRAQTESMMAVATAIHEMTVEMREMREQAQGQTEGMAAALGDLASTLESLKPALAGKSR